jgi:mono/diheme cytochrome c family protein
LPQRWWGVIVAVALTATALNARAQEADVVAGHAFAREACNACHMVEAQQRLPRLIVIGPAFRDIANTRGITATALRVFLTTSHSKMPNLILTPEETADVIAYILSLRDRPHLKPK